LGREELKMGYKQAFEMLDLMELEKEIEWHFLNNLDPLPPYEMVSVAVKAIVLCREGKLSENILIPIEGRIGWVVPAYTVVKTYDLQPWMNELEVI